MAGTIRSDNIRGQVGVRLGYTGEYSVKTFDLKQLLHKHSLNHFVKTSHLIAKTTRNKLRPEERTNLMMFSYSLSFPFESRHFLYITDASTLAGENVFGSFSKEIMLSKIVLKKINSIDFDPNERMEEHAYRKLFATTTELSERPVPDVLCWVPPFRWQLSALWIINWRV